MLELNIAMVGDMAIVRAKIPKSIRVKTEKI